MPTAEDILRHRDNQQLRGVPHYARITEARRVFRPDLVAEFEAYDYVYE